MAGGEADGMVLAGRGRGASGAFDAPQGVVVARVLHVHYLLGLDKDFRMCHTGVKAGEVADTT